MIEDRRNETSSNLSRRHFGDPELDQQRAPISTMRCSIPYATGIYGVEQSATIDSPVLSWGSASDNPINPATRAFLYDLFPQHEEVILEGGDHFSVTTDPAAVAEPIAEFVSLHSAAAALT